MSIGMIILNETNCKWNTRSIEKLQNKLNRVSKDVNVSTSYSKQHELTNNYYFPGVTLTATIGKLSSYVVDSTKKDDKLGKWNAIKINHDGEIITVIN